MENKTFFIAIAGGTGSGKTYVAKRLQELVNQDVTIISHDNYYRDQSNIPMEERKNVNYDEPAALDNDLFFQQLTELKSGKLINIPQYDFSTHTRKPETATIHPTPVVIVEGILILTEERIRELFDLVVFIDVDADVRLARRLKRDVGERDRNYEESLKQYLTSAQPMHDKWVEPEKEFADLIINNNGELSELDKAIETLVARVKEIIAQQK